MTYEQNLEYCKLILEMVLKAGRSNDNLVSIRDSRMESEYACTEGWTTFDPSFDSIYVYHDEPQFDADGEFIEDLYYDMCSIQDCSTEEGFFQCSLIYPPDVMDAFFFYFYMKNNWKLDDGFYVLNSELKHWKVKNDIQ